MRIFFEHTIYNKFIFPVKYADNTGSASVNETLSQQRAEAVVAFLTAKGISASRMTAKGYGSSKPVAPNTTDDGRQQNRRTEFEIKGN